ncbi:MAG: peptidoglycan DD-metalloendopeptidase family protein [Lutibacter sp.]|uniref:murein hydrolase activator EnvC family protein n=1 Tax=Lutibacter sp. TaxID=1925666 RepID=UPI00184167D8|nr:peptidoglycan DD-metalloendopeptidase family protein [Lutibacter sp.]MBT8317934.1 peptidoglycan DD-metalloendopeptidase family protein [Lutibacter sp.]NNJ58792.1 peptidoglycan DD-metalloendopeptidase family protein [Lutibacter sp.]
MQFKLKYLLFSFSLLISAPIFAQKTKRQVLEARRVQNQKDQIYINALLSNTKRKEKNLLSDLSDLKDKIKIRENLITAISNEANELDNEIYLNQLEINQNRRDLKALKKDYADMIFQSYKSKSQNSRIMFLLSSENFYQGYKRFQYMKQYTSFRKKQGEEIFKRTENLQILTDTLQLKKELKQALLLEQQKEKNAVEKEKNEQENLLSQVKKKENKYKKQIKQFQKEEARIDALIEKAIRDAIAASNKKNTTTGSSNKTATFTLTAEAKELASKFTLNKGKLPWPVEKGYVSTYYGKQPHPIVKTATIQSNGVRITTNKGSKARAVFEGTVLAVQVMTGNKKAVLIQHGNYITVYKNLENITVNKGDKLKTKQIIGTIFTDKITDKTILGFVLSNNTKTENPRNWIYKM